MEQKQLKDTLMAECALRRKKLLSQLPPKSLVLLPSAKETIRSNDTHYPFRQSSDFYYLTGFNEPEALLVLISGEPHEYILFNRPRDVLKETWDGRRAGQEGAVSQYGADKSENIHTFEAQLPTLLSQCEKVYFPLGENLLFDELILRHFHQLRGKSRRGVAAPSGCEDLRPFLHEMRLFKSAFEIECMKKAAHISVKAQEAAMKKTKPGVKEYELQAELEYIFKKEGAASPAYSSIVGSGENTCILHYIENDKTLQAGELVLIDAGSEYENYASDITRTFPVNGVFSKEQKAIYELVLKAQTAVLDGLKPGIPFSFIQETVVKVLVEGLVELGLLKGNPETLIKEKAYEPFYMHQASHWLGLDTHDVGVYQKDGVSRLLAPGMVLTVEPGLYVSSGSKVPSAWWNIGVRIEDDVLITETGCELLSKGLPRTVKEIEASMRGSSPSPQPSPSRGEGVGGESLSLSPFSPSSLLSPHSPSPLEGEGWGEGAGKPS